MDVTAGDRPRRPRGPLHVLAYGLSLPERLLRSLLGALGLVGRSLTFLIPGPLRRTKFYRTAVERQIRMITDIVGRADVYRDAEEVLDASATVRMGIGGAIDNLMILGLHASPIWLLLAATDVCEGAKNFTRKLGAELKEAGFMKEGSRLDSVDDVLEGLQKLSNRLADTFDKPPLSLDQMKQTVSSIRTDVTGAGAAIGGTARIDALARDLTDIADRGRRSVIEVSSAVAIGALEGAGRLVAGTAWGAVSAVRIFGQTLWTDVVLDYAKAATRARRLGLYGSLRRFLRPQRRSLAKLFSYGFVSWTEIGLSLGRWRQPAWA